MNGLPFAGTAFGLANLIDRHTSNDLLHAVISLSPGQSINTLPPWCVQDAPHQDGHVVRWSKSTAEVTIQDVSKRRLIPRFSGSLVRGEQTKFHLLRAWPNSVPPDIPLLYIHIPIPIYWLDYTQGPPDCLPQILPNTVAQSSLSLSVPPTRTTVPLLPGFVTPLPVAYNFPTCHCRAASPGSAAPAAAQECPENTNVHVEETSRDPANKYDRSIMEILEPLY